ncbi:NAD-dependent epimerase/dehydratase family protein [Rhodospirillum rubrum]|uniref:NAD-dependent epimerase/dehydratase n=1 Tax=Rhodospirillum rubrum (strain ATCC 11170 / ATH 1.1.1 / DSM 467 / LMG 4362 / NCIMB 8255 / S1) TaxID=269796 RepID=Q2RPP2_RHORT|nr:NAD-dependent epimerase/dehydratase family protein [Rhodospirillum rubrum]ABC23903.1 NAD-dependent epimerase/dehydratase [Rhodospirillum rubrum ATCC 11170]AEO49647.1 NAD-dependent epimerase/dehydratase [Rhodospirillum rubrum F11]QXG79847.1 NAD-dependent epimerase/dehydratase family protein [Rhodospirillum rubrum]
MTALTEIDARHAAWRGRRVLVTGGAGFIGGHLCRRLVGLGAEVVVLDDLSTGRRDTVPRGVRLIVGSVTDPALVRKALQGTEGCFHLAAIASVPLSVSALVDCHAVNQTGTLRLIEGLRDNGGGRLVYASSSAVFGDPVALPLTMASPTRPISPYGVDKLACEAHARVAGGLYGLKSFGLRFFNVYGEGQSDDSPYSGVIALFNRKLRDGQPITVFGDGSQSRDFVYVGDVIEGLLAAWNEASVRGPVETVGTGCPTTVMDLARTIMEVHGRSVPVVHAPPREADIEHSYGKADFLARILPKPAVALRAGLARTLSISPPAATLAPTP